MKIPESVISTISDRIAIEEIIGGYVTLTRKGSKYWGLCPFHQEKTPSFSVDPEKKFFHCFGCKKGGTVFNFLMEMEKCTFPDAVRILAKKLGIVIPEFEGESQEDEKRRNALHELYDRVGASLHYILMERPEAEKARAYLAGRCIADSVWKDFQLGYVPEEGRWLYDFLRKRSYSDAFLAESGLFAKNHPDFSLFSGRLVFPIRAPRGGIIAFGGRTLSERGPKYINSPETAIFQKKNTLYGLDRAIPAIKNEGTFILVEGYMDVISMHAAGKATAVAPLGTAFTGEQAMILKRFARKGILLFDSDSAGQEATKRAMMICQQNGIDSSVIVLKGGKDPAEILQKDGAEALNNSIKYSINSFEYLVQNALSSWDRTLPEGKEAILQEVYPFIQESGSAVVREGYLKQLSELLDVEYATILQGLKKHPETGSFHAFKELFSPKKSELSPDLYLMLALSANMERYSAVRSQIHYEDLESPASRELYVVLEYLYRKGITSFDALLCRIGDEKTRAIVTERINSDEFAQNQEQVIRDTMQRVRQRSLERKLKRVMGQLKEYEKTGEKGDALKELLVEKMYLDKELFKLRERN